MTVEDNKAVLRRAAYLELYDPKIVLHGYQGVKPGLASATQFYQAFWTAFPDCKLTEESVNGANLAVQEELVGDDMVTHTAVPGIAPIREGFRASLWKLISRLFQFNLAWYSNWS